MAETRRNHAEKRQFSKRDPPSIPWRFQARTCWHSDVSRDLEPIGSGIKEDVLRIDGLHGVQDIA
jgi:hypothetical protein